MVDWTPSPLLNMAVNRRSRRACNSLMAHLPLLLVMMTSSVDAQRSYRRQVGVLRSTNELPTDPWQLFNISIRHNTGNRTEGMLHKYLLIGATKHRIGYIGVQIMLLLDMTQYKVVKSKRLGSVLVKQFRGPLANRCARGAVSLVPYIS